MHLPPKFGYEWAYGSKVSLFGPIWAWPPGPLAWRAHVPFQERLSSPLMIISTNFGLLYKCALKGMMLM